MDEAYTDDNDTKTGHCVEAKTGHCGEAKTGHCGEAINKIRKLLLVT